MGAWDGRYTAFLVRPAVRLWPVYAICFAVGGILMHEQVPLLQYAWLPISTAHAPPKVDPPAWSLTIEAWAMVLMPAYVWIGRRSVIYLAAASAATCLVARLYPPLVMLVFFFVGAWLSRYELRWRPLEHWLPQWLGRISYPLYLCHWPVIFGSGLPLWLSIPLAFLVAVVLTATIEKWSIRASRWISRRWGMFRKYELASG